MNIMGQGENNPSDQQENFMQNIQDMVTGLLKNEIDKMQKSEMDKQLGGADQSVPDAGADAAAPAMDITDIKKIVSSVQKFLDNVNMMIAQLEGGNTAYTSDEGKFLDAYLNTADNILEMAAFSTKDNLTGLSNRHGFDSRLILEWNRASREKSPLSLLLFEIDGFIQGAEGREQNNDILVAIAKSLEHTIKRSTDYIAHWSDEGFAALLPITGVEGAMIVAERIRNEIENLDIPHIRKNGGKITAFIGISVQKPEQNEQAIDFINKAIDALKKAHEGQDRIVLDYIEN